MPLRAVPPAITRLESQVAKPPYSVAAAHLRLLLNALVWLAFGILIAASGRTLIPGSVFFKWGTAILALVTSGILLGLVIFLTRRSRIAYFASLAVLATLTILTITDQVGLADIAVLGITIAAIVCLVSGRAWYLRGHAGTPTQNGAT